jgi:adenylate kinase
MPENEPRKIALVGTSGIGKTTVLEYFKHRFAGDSTVVFVEEAARTFFIEHPEIMHRFSEDSQGQVQTLALRNEKLAYLDNPKVIICDRSVIDAVAYVRAQGIMKDQKGFMKKLPVGFQPITRFCY